MNVAWLRVDDGFTHHPKIVKLSRADRWTWLEVLCYAARFRTEGKVSARVGEVVRGASPAFLERCLGLHLLDLAEDSSGDYQVHDWDDYNGREPKLLKSERQRRWREKASTSASTPTSTPASTSASTPTSTRAQARARVPQPQEEPLAKDVTAAKDVTKGSSQERPRNELWDALTELFGEPSTRSAQTLRGRVCSSLATAGAKPDDVLARARAWPRHFDNATLTETALEKHWDTLGRIPLRLEERRGRSVRAAG